MKKIEEIKTYPFFKNFTDEDLKEFAEFSFPLKIKSGEILFEEGSSGSDLYVIKRGKGEVVKKGGQTGEEYKIAEIEEGNIIGEIAWILGKKRTATFRAKTDMEVLRIDGDILKRKIEEGSKGAVSFLFELLKLEAERLFLTSGELIKFLEKVFPKDEISRLRETISKTIAF